MWKKKLIISFSVLSVLMNTLSVGAAGHSDIGVHGEETIQDNSGDLTDEILTYSVDNNKQKDETDNQDLISVSVRTIPGRWIESGGRWWYQHNDGGYTTNGWEEIGGKWYYFDAQGWMKVDEWIQDGGKWYYVDSSGAMIVENWKLLGGKWYYFDAHGAMVTGWLRLGDNNWYYFDNLGRMKIGEMYENGSYYYFDLKGHLNTTTLGIIRQDQIYSNWCWAVVASLIGGYDCSTKRSQREIVQYITGGQSNVTTNIDETARAVRYASGFTKNASGVLRALSFNEVLNNIDNRHPFGVGLVYYNSGHIVTGAGYNKSLEMIYIHDSSPFTESNFFSYRSLINDTHSLAIGPGFYGLSVVY